ncbi:MAG: DeoR/GlpR family DNA-binding transcription regulator [Treponema sp.]|jgi:DeoR/GlpR family transcriptional regulator of sugar metabolism|nr:DeoR/GlpR family DNA-binding transcription regulator [Treponema sp.]
MRYTSFSDRKKFILNNLADRKVLPVSEIAAGFPVSGETLRKDLILMEREGLVRRYHGSVALVSQGAAKMSIAERRTIYTATKMKLAEEVYRHLPKDRNTVIGLDVGNTVWHLAKLLLDRERRTIVTNSQEIVELYANQSKSEVYCTGGLQRDYDRGFYGPWTVRNINTASMSAVVLSSAGVKNQNGLGGVSFEDAEAKRAYRKNSALVIAMIDSSKFSQCAMVSAVPWEDVDILVTDRGIPDQDRECLKKLVKLAVAD